MINKYQQGGAAPQLGGSILEQIQQLPQEQQLQIMQAFAQWAQQKGVDISQLQQNPAALEQALGQFMQEVQAQQAQMARQGAKLQYIKNLKKQCGPDEELQYYKVGGSIGCGCVKKQKGGEMPQKKNALQQFKEKKQKLNSDSIQSHKKLPIKSINKPFKNDYSSKRVKDSEADYFAGKGDHEIKGDKCGGKMKKHQIGGTLEQLRKSLGL